MAKQQWNHLQTTSCRRAHQTHTTCLPVLDKCLVCRLPWMGRGRSTALWPQSSAFSLIDSSNFRIYWIWTFYARCPPLRWVTIFWKRGTSKTPDRQLIALFLITGFTKNLKNYFSMSVKETIFLVNHVLHEYLLPFVQVAALCLVWVLDTLRQFALNWSVVTFVFVLVCHVKSRRSENVPNGSDMDVSELRRFILFLGSQIDRCREKLKLPNLMSLWSLFFDKQKKTHEINKRHLRHAQEKVCELSADQAFQNMSSKFSNARPPWRTRYGCSSYTFCIGSPCDQLMARVWLPEIVVLRLLF